MSLPRVAIVVPALEEEGGVPAVGLFLAQAMRDSGRYTPEFVSLPVSASDELNVPLRTPRRWREPPGVERTHWRGFPVVRVGARFGELEFQRYRPRPELTRELRRAQLVFIVAGTPAWGLAARGVGRPVALQVATLARQERREALRRGGGALGGWRRLMTQVTARLDGRGLRHVDAVFVENAWLREHLETRLGHAQVFFAPPGVDVELFRPPAARRREPGPILCVGRLHDPRKRVDLLFEAYALLCRSGDPPPLVLAGHTGPGPHEWARAESLGIAERVSYRAELSPKALAALYREAGLFALASDEEGLGIVLLEAMAAGLPVVSSDCGGPATSVVHGETGFLVPRGDARALATRMQELLASATLRERMGMRARERAVSHFSREVTARPFLAWCDRALRT